MLWLQIPSRSDLLRSADATEAVRKPAWRHVGLCATATLALEGALANHSDRQVPSITLGNDILKGVAGQGSDTPSNQQLTGNSRALNSSLSAHKLHTLLPTMPLLTNTFVLPCWVKHVCTTLSTCMSCFRAPKTQFSAACGHVRLAGLPSSDTPKVSAWRLPWQCHHARAVRCESAQAWLPS
jgi:hypothetical protein